jgi:hypothetical protein
MLVNTVGVKRLLPLANIFSFPFAQEHHFAALVFGDGYLKTRLGEQWQGKKEKKHCRGEMFFAHGWIPVFVLS